MFPHLVIEEDLAKAGNRAKPAGEQTTGDPEKAFQKADIRPNHCLEGRRSGILSVHAERGRRRRGRRQGARDSHKGMSFKAACQKLGVNSISEMGENVPRNAQQEGLNTGGVGGVQMADVSVDTETGS